MSFKIFYLWFRPLVATVDRTWCFCVLNMISTHDIRAIEVYNQHKCIKLHMIFRAVEI
jgi:hypothetical protein